MPHVREVDTDLVGPTGAQAALNQARATAQGCDTPEVRLGRLAALGHNGEPLLMLPLEHFANLVTEP